MFEIFESRNPSCPFNLIGINCQISMNMTSEKENTQHAVLQVKAFVYTLLIALATGFAHPYFLGFHPILQGILLGLVSGTIAGKLFSIHREKFRSRVEPYLLAGGLFLAFLIGQWMGLSLAYAENDWGFLCRAWLQNDFRDMVQWGLSPETGYYVDNISRGWWLFWFVLDAAVFYPVSLFSLRLAVKASRKQKRARGEWSVYRMLLLYACLLFSLYYLSKDAVSQNLQGIESWKQEMGADRMIEKVYNNIEGIVSNGLTQEAFALEDVVSTMAEEETLPFPEGHLMLAIQHLKDGNYFLAKADIDRAIYQTEGLDRRVTLEDGKRIHRDQFLAHLYEFRAKLLMKKDMDLAAERNLTIAIKLHEEYWLEENQIPDTGFYAHESEILNDAGYLPQFGFGACYYERYQIRLKLDDEQAKKDLEESAELGFQPPTPIGS